MPEGYPTEDDERVLRMTKLEIEIEKGRKEMQRLDQEIRADGRKFFVQAGITVAACVSAGVAAGAFLVPRHSPPVASPPQIIIIQAPPGTTATVLPPGATQGPVDGGSAAPAPQAPPAPPAQ